MSGIFITSYSAICNCGSSIKEIYQNIISGKNIYLTPDDKIIKDKKLLFGKVFENLPEISDSLYDIRANKLILHCYEQIKKDVELSVKEYGKNRIGVVIGSTNSGVEEYENTNDCKHTEISNPAEFLHNYIGLNSFFLGVSTACTSGAKAFSTAQRLLEQGICDAVIVGGTDPIASVPVFGFDSLEVESDSVSNPFSKNRCGMNIGEGAALFLLEKKKRNAASCVKLCSTGESSDAYHSASPDPEGKQAVLAIKKALKKAGLKSSDISYINLHGTGTVANDLMEANAVYKIFGTETFCSSTKPFTGHCLGAAAAIEAAICVFMLDTNAKKLPPHVYDGIRDDKLPVINLVEQNAEKQDITYCLSNSFGFGGTNSVIIFGKENR